MKLNYGHGEKEIIVSAWTLYLYECEFKGGDMIADVFGRVEIGGEDDGALVIDYSKTNWTSVIKALWACLKAADASLPPFEEWAKTLGTIDLYEVVSTVVPEMQRNLFQSGASDSE